MSKYNNLGKLCIICVVINLIIAWIMAMQGNPISMINIISAFFCHLGSFSNKCRTKNVEL